MKKFLTLFLTAVFAVALSGVFVSCDRHERKQKAMDQQEVVQQVAQYVNPEFTDATAFMTYTSTEVKKAEFLSIISELEPYTIETVALQTLRQQGKDRHLTWVTWMNEYNTNKPIYQQMDYVAKKSKGKTDAIPIPNSSSKDSIVELSVGGSNATVVKQSSTTVK